MIVNIPSIRLNVQKTNFSFRLIFIKKKYTLSLGCDYLPHHSFLKI